LRFSSADVFSLVDVANGEMIGTLEAARAFSTVHDGAVYLHLGRAYEVVQLDLAERRALLQPFGGDWFTQPKRETATAIERLVERREAMGVTLSFGNVVVTEVVTGYQRKALSDHQQIDFRALDLPETAFSTQALWYELDAETLGADAFAIERLLGALHATEHAQIAVLPLLAMCDRWDIGGLSTNAHPQTGRPTIFIYDGHPGGVGITRAGYRGFERLVGDAHRLIAECRCKRGCPSCIQSPKCGNLNEPLSKAGALALLKRLLAG
jgi:DEAD/DEAH box helicase domain-containing protein